MSGHSIGRFDWVLTLNPIDGLMRERFASDSPDLRRRARLVAAFGVLACSGGWSLAFSHFFLFDISLTRVVAPFFAGTVALLSPILLARTRWLSLCAHLVAACWLLAVGWGMWLRGGLASPPLMSQVAVPFIALVILDRRAAALWSGVVAAELATYGGLLTLGIDLPDFMPPQHRLTSNVVAAGLFGTLMLAMGIAMEWLREEASTELAVAIQRKALAEREASMLRAERLASVGQLVASLAHEINNPLSYLLGNLHYLSDELTQPELRSAVIDALDGATRVKTIMQDLKTFSRDDDERVVPVDLATVVASSLRLVKGETRHRTSVVQDFQQCPLVLATPTRIGQIVINLMVNAAQASSEERPNLITVSLDTTADGRARLSVSDTGVGIPPEILARVTEPFFTTKPVGVGTGLGLSVCSNLAARMGGVLEVRSTLGVGTTVRVTLPPAPDDDEAEPLPTVQPIPSGPRMRILVVDDEPAMLRSLERALGGHDVVTALGGEAALALLRRDTAFDLVLCDVMMPEPSGVAVAQAIRQLDPGLDARVVLITAGATNDRTRAFLSANRYPVLPKPLDLTALLRLVASTEQRRVA
jgi:signal transduction histidine kinase